MEKTSALLATTMVLLAAVVISCRQKMSQEVTLTEAISIATERIPGEVIRTERERRFYENKIPIADGLRKIPGEAIKTKGDRRFYEIKIPIAGGLRKEVYINSKTS